MGSEHKRWFKSNFRTSAHTRTHRHTHAYTYAHTYTHTHAYTHAHTHTHTYKNTKRSPSTFLVSMSSIKLWRSHERRSINCLLLFCWATLFGFLVVGCGGALVCASGVGPLSLLLVGGSVVLGHVCLLPRFAWASWPLSYHAPEGWLCAWWCFIVPCVLLCGPLRRGRLSVFNN